MRTGSTLLIQSSEGMEPLGAFNQPVYHNLSQIRESLARKFDQDTAAYFARPDIDPDGARISWTATRVGEPRRWIDLSPEEQAALEPTKQEYHARLAKYQAELAEAAPGSARYDLSLVLKQALKVPGPEYLYFMDGKPVVAFWGFKRAGLPEGIDPLLLEPQVVRFAPGNTIPSSPGGFAVPPGEPALVLVTPWWRRLWWLWWLLAGLLLLLLLLWLLLPRYGVPLPVWSPGAPGIDLPTPAYPNSQRSLPGGEVPVGPAGIGPGGSIPLGASPANPDAAPSAGGADLAPAAPGAAGPAVPSGASGAPPDAGPASPSAAQGQPAPNDRHSPTDPKAPPMGNLPAGAPKSGTPLQLPSNAKPGPADYMEGEWRSRSGLIDPKGNPLEETYKFDKTGQGQVVVRSKDGRECTGAAEATTGADGSLRVGEPANLTCNDGGSLAGAVTTCTKGADGRVNCKGQNDSDGTKFGVQMEHLDGH